MIIDSGHNIAFSGCRYRATADAGVMQMWNVFLPCWTSGYGCTMRLCWILSLASVLFCGGCAKDDPNWPAFEDLSACFTVDVEYAESGCPEIAGLKLDASCSTDPKTPTDSLQVRWDYDNDGHWDTEFRTIDRIGYYDAPAAGPRNWTTRCEVKNPSGETDQTTRTVDLGPRPPSPDLVVKAMWLGDGSTSPNDT